MFKSICITLAIGFSSIGFSHELPPFSRVETMNVSDIQSALGFLKSEKGIEAMEVYMDSISMDCGFSAEEILDSMSEVVSLSLEEEESVEE